MSAVGTPVVAKGSVVTATVTLLDDLGSQAEPGLAVGRLLGFASGSSGDTLEGARLRCRDGSVVVLGLAELRATLSRWPALEVADLPRGERFRIAWNAADDDLARARVGEIVEVAAHHSSGYLPSGGTTVINVGRLRRWDWPPGTDEHRFSWATLEDPSGRKFEVPAGWVVGFHETFPPPPHSLDC